MELISSQVPGATQTRYDHSKLVQYTAKRLHHQSLALYCTDFTHIWCPKGYKAPQTVLPRTNTWRQLIQCATNKKGKEKDSNSTTAHISLLNFWRAAWFRCSFPISTPISLKLWLGVQTKARSASWINAPPARSIDLPAPLASKIDVHLGLVCNFVLLHQSNNFGRGIIPSLVTEIHAVGDKVGWPTADNSKLV